MRTFARLDSLEHVLGRSDGDIRSVVLNESLANDAALNNESVTLRPVTTEESGSVKVLTDSLGESTSVIGEEVDVGSAVAAELLLPGVDGELVVHGDDVDVLNALGLELGGVLDVAWNLRRAGSATLNRDRY